ncbi:MAG: hypothetical protein BTN85_0541 [Candidatus Methanohalarchaeum thermophilum]|uniref:Uncharacterized protein n=1 Tax=Methanohalarchaeum thermophilum TaxID=1903181 RepID=A0A1Q6DUM3_METT1|nr:MAG: hypothetical protein BTN85_0541 [Candidatus Methanohalarchaeum thermophilum]
MNVSSALRRSGINVPVKTGREIEGGWELCESKLFRKNDKFYLNPVLEIEACEVDEDEYNGVLGIALGLHNPVARKGLGGAVQPAQSLFWRRRRQKYSNEILLSPQTIRYR